MDVSSPNISNPKVWTTSIPSICYMLHVSVMGSYPDTTISLWQMNSPNLSVSKFPEFQSMTIWYQTAPQMWYKLGTIAPWQKLQLFWEGKIPNHQETRMNPKIHVQMWHNSRIGYDLLTNVANAACIEYNFPELSLKYLQLAQWFPWLWFLQQISTYNSLAGMALAPEFEVELQVTAVIFLRRWSMKRTNR